MEYSAGYSPSPFYPPPPETGPNLSFSREYYTTFTGNIQRTLIFFHFFLKKTHNITKRNYSTAWGDGENRRNTGAFSLKEL
jgi:hypothetical protein